MKKIFLLASALLVLLCISSAVANRLRASSSAPPKPASRIASLDTRAGVPSAGAPEAAAAAAIASPARRPADRALQAPQRKSRVRVARVDGPESDAPSGRGGAPRFAAGASDDGEEKQPKAPATAESMAQWTFSDGDAVVPFVSAELRDMTPIRTSRDEPRVVENERLPYRGERPGQAPVRGDGALQSQPDRTVSAPTPTGVSFARYRCERARPVGRQRPGRPEPLHPDRQHAVHGLQQDGHRPLRTGAGQHAVVVDLGTVQDAQ